MAIVRACDIQSGNAATAARARLRRLLRCGAWPGLNSGAALSQNNVQAESAFPSALNCWRRTKRRWLT